MEDFTDARFFLTYILTDIFKTLRPGDATF